MRLRAPLPAQVLLTLGVLGGLGFLAHYSALYFRDFSLVCIMALFVWLVISTKIDSRVVTHALLPAFGLLLFTLFFAYVFLLRVEGAPFLPSLLAQRQYSFFLIGPVVYLLYRRGWKMEDFQRIFIVSVLLVIANQVVYDLVFASNSLLLSGSFFTLRLATATEESTATRMVEISAMFAVFYFGRRIFQTKEVLLVGFGLAAIAFSVVLLMITIPRALSASIVLAVVLYLAFLARPGRIRLAAVMFPLYAVLGLVLSSPLSRAFSVIWGDDLTWTTRINSAGIAWEYFLRYPLFGFGSDSVHSVSFQDLFGDKFYPADIGLLGVAFHYGSLGVALYVGFVAWLCISLLKMRWDYSGKMAPKHSAFIGALFMVCLVFIIVSPLQARFLYSQGLPIGSFCWGLLMAHGHAMANARSANPPRESSAPADTANSNSGHEREGNVEHR